jgi:hypothetical protein
MKCIELASKGKNWLSVVEAVISINLDTGDRYEAQTLAYDILASWKFGQGFSLHPGRVFRCVWIAIMKRIDCYWCKRKIDWWIRLLGWQFDLSGILLCFHCWRLYGSRRRHPRTIEDDAKGLHPRLRGGWSAASDSARSNC